MFKVLILLTSLVLATAYESSTYNLYFNDTTYLDSFRGGDYYFQAYYHPLFNQTIGFLKNLSDSETLDLKCRNSLKRWTHGIETGEAWAIKFLESTGRTITGKLTGRNVNFGSFEFCSGFKSDQAENVDFDGKYCMVSVQTRETEIIKGLENYQSYYRKLSDSGKRLLEFNIGNAHGVCLPSSCEVEQVAEATNRVFKTFGLRVFTTEDSKCYTRSNPEPLTKMQIVSFAIIIAFMFLCFLAFFIKTEFLSNFYIPKNFDVIYNTDFKDKESEERMNLHGAKAAMICLSIITHSFVFYGAYFAPPFGTIKEQEVRHVLRIWLERYLPFASMMFLFGGFFASYAWHDVIKKKTIKFNFMNFVVIRYVKVAISSIPVILLFFILPQLSHGPYYSSITNHLADNCRRNGYKIFTLTTNLGDSFLDMCTVGNWYLSADFQVYLVSYFVIYYLAAKPRLGFALALIQCVFFSVVSILYTKYYDISAYFNALDLQIYAVDRGQDTYFPFFLHYNVYTVGMITGWLVKNKIKPKVMDYKLFRIITWITLLTSTYLVFWFPHEVEHGRMPSNFLIETVYRLVDKVIFSTTLAWAIYSTSFGYSRPLVWLLTNKFWLPWSRLSFTLALCQFVFIGYSFSTSRSIFTFNFDSIIREIFVNLMFTFLLGNFIFLFIEGPVISLLKSYVGLKGRSESTEKSIRKEK